MFIHQIELLKKRLSGLNTRGKEYTELALENAPKFAELKAPIHKNPIREVIIQSTIYSIPIFGVAALNISSTLWQNLLFSISAAPPLVISFLNLARWSSWESLKDEVKARTFNFDRLLKHAANSSRMFKAAIVFSVMTTMFLTLVDTFIENGMNFALLFIIPLLFFSLYKGILTKVRTAYLLHLSEDITRFKGDYDGENEE